MWSRSKKKKQFSAHENWSETVSFTTPPYLCSIYQPSCVCVCILVNNGGNTDEAREADERHCFHERPGTEPASIFFFSRMLPHFSSIPALQRREYQMCPQHKKNLNPEHYWNFPVLPVLLFLLSIPIPFTRSIVDTSEKKKFPEEAAKCMCVHKYIYHDKPLYKLGKPCICAHVPALSLVRRKTSPYIFFSQQNFFFSFSSSRSHSFSLSFPSCVQICVCSRKKMWKENMYILWYWCCVFSPSFPFFSSLFLWMLWWRWSREEEEKIYKTFFYTAPCRRQSFSSIRRLIEKDVCVP